MHLPLLFIGVDCEAPAGKKKKKEKTQVRFVHDLVLTFVKEVRVLKVYQTPLTYHL